MKGIPIDFLRDLHKKWCVARRKSARTDERGAMGGLEGLAFGILLFAFGTLMVVNAWAVVDGKMVAGAAAREATRTFVEAPNQRAAADGANAAALDVVNGRRDAHTRINVSALDNAGFGRCEKVTATVQIDVPRVSLPLIGGTGGTFPVSSSHTEVIDPYRSGLGSTADCG